jgi:hypothetical protein
MPRSGGGVYSKPAGTTAVPNTTIESAKFNSVIDDLVADANAARPVSAGGTGSANAADARAALGISATNTPFTPTGAIAATNVQTALAELDAEKAALAGATFTGNVTVLNPSADGHPVNRITGDGRYALSSIATGSIFAITTGNVILPSQYRAVLSAAPATINAFVSGVTGRRYEIVFNDVYTITNSGGLATPGNRNIVTAVGDFAIVQSTGATTSEIISYFRADTGSASVTWTDISSASTMAVGAVNSENLRVTGTTTVTSLGTTASGITRTLRAASGFQLTHSANIVCPGAANLVLLADDYVRVTCIGGGVWHVTDVRSLATTTAPGLMSAADKVKVNAVPAFVSVASVATTSGTAFDFTGLPSDTVKISLNFSGVSLSGTDNFLVQLGDSGGFETTGYSGAGTGTTGAGGGTVANSSGFIVRVAIAAELMSGTMTFEKVSGTNEWIASHSLGGTTTSAFGGGAKTLSDVLTQVRLTRTGANTFDAGSVSLTYVRAS